MEKKSKQQPKRQKVHTAFENEVIVDSNTLDEAVTDNSDELLYGEKSEDFEHWDDE